MGMFNEVYKRCPECGGRGEMQISQIILGFGEFDLDNKEDIADRLDKYHIRRLVARVKEREWFTCRMCGNEFRYNEQSNSDKIEILNELD